MSAYLPIVCNESEETYWLLRGDLTRAQARVRIANELGELLEWTFGWSILARYMRPAFPAEAESMGCDRRWGVAMFECERDHPKARAYWRIDVG